MLPGVDTANGGIAAACSTDGGAEVATPADKVCDNKCGPLDKESHRGAIGRDGIGGTGVLSPLSMGENIVNGGTSAFTLAA